MSNLQDFNNIYADLAESAYTGKRPNNFPPKSNKNTSQYFNFSKPVTKNIGTEKKPVYQTTQGGTTLPNKGVVYLQPAIKDPDAKNVYTGQGGAVDALAKNMEAKSVFDNTSTGFQSYFVTDTAKPKDATQAYLAIRGSDAASLQNMNDWTGNNLPFAVGSKEMPQAKDATKAMKAVLKELPKNTKLEITGHSLGTMVSVQGVAQLVKDDPSALKRIGKLVLFDGPDCTQSLKKMGLSEDQIKKIGKLVTYYVNPLDIVSMLNRTAPIKEQFGTVQYVVPLDFGTTFDKISAHDFGEFQLDANGNPLVASKDFHPEFLEAGEKLATLESTALKQLKALGLSDSAASTLLSLATSGHPLRKGTEGYAIIAQFQSDYADLIKNTRRQSKNWDTAHIPDLQRQISHATTSGQRISLRAELLDTVAQDAVFQAEDYRSKVKDLVSKAKEDIKQEIQSTREAAYDIAAYLSPYEIDELLNTFQFSDVWSDAIEDETKKAADNYQKEVEQFSATLLKVSQNIQDTDKEKASDFTKNLKNVQQDWGK
ncbi:Mbeg1-like protein [Lactococcus nasutitermitis]|uniref:Mbeg1-like protein n=1 Tax=Lactococcus nasutitermitis TaxID=1652957 RepID=A0ABV9JCF6_9LACT|nr:Mbeg1-like protein [Lactococcus nasutitermitis]